MAAWRGIGEGGCRCGRVRFATSLAPLVTMACHCRGCQRMCASAFSLSALYRADGFAIIAGEPVAGGLHGAARHMGCGYCLGWLYTRPDGTDEVVNVRATTFDDIAGYAPFIDTMTDEALPWAQTPAEHRFPGFPPPDAYPALIAAYAGR